MSGFGEPEVLGVGKGWTPVLAVVVDGARRVHQVVDWTGGGGVKPATGQYVGAAGYVADLATAVDIRGAAGVDGAAGNTILYGAGAPAAGTGVDGNFYIDTAANSLHGPKAAGAWPAGTSMIGPAGGNGAAGAAGNTVLYGAGAPAAGTGVDGNFYIDTTSHSLYGPKAAGAWPAGTSMIGPAGADAATQGTATYTIGGAGTWATIGDALTALRGRARQQNANVILEVDDLVQVRSSPLAGFANEDLSWITIRPKNTPPVLNPAGPITVSGTVRNWSVNIPITNAYLYFTALSSDYAVLAPGSLPASGGIAALFGYWKITAVDATSITVLNTSSLTITGQTVADMLIFMPKVRIQVPGVFISAYNAKTPIFRGFGVSCSTAYPSQAGTEICVTADGDSTVYFGHPNYTAGEAPDWRNGVFINGFNTSCRVFRSSLNGIGCFSAAKFNNLNLWRGSEANIIGIIATGAGAAGDTADNAVVYSSSSVECAGGFAADLPCVFAGASRYGVYAAFGSDMFVGNGVVAGNAGVADLYSNQNTLVTLALTNTVVGATSPAVNTVGNNNCYNARA